MTVHGIDVSHWQGEMNWQTAANAGVKFAFIKATQGTGVVDTQFSRNWSETARLGIYRGAYHFYDARYQPLGQAQHFFNVVSANGMAGMLPPVCDFEVDGVPSSTLKQFLDEVERLFGIKPIIYTSVRYWYADPPYWTSDYPLWVANWGAPAPTLPRGWSEWLFWQYSANGNGLGSEYGAQSGDIDLNWYSGTLAELAALAGDEMTDPTPELPAQVRVTMNSNLIRYLDIFNRPTWSASAKIGHIEKGAILNVVGWEQVGEGEGQYICEIAVPKMFTEPVDDDAA